jgi:acetyl-CoA/propionyl-CoA carboxylase biotin carboxyl carrier protein
VDEELLTPREVAGQLGVTTRTVQRWIAGGRLPGVRVGGRLRVSRSSLAAVAGGLGEGADDLPGPRRSIRSLLIANRGEIATRIARTARRLGIRVVGVHAADEAPPEGIDEAQPITSYLDPGALLAAASRTGADAIHPGYGFLAEDPHFARLVEAAGLVWVGPPPDAMAAMGDKAAARHHAAELGIAVVPGYDGDGQQDEVLAAEAARIGVPLLVKPAGGGGGKGMHVVRDLGELDEALAASRREARRAFGDDRLILERLLEGARHVELQVLFDAHGFGIHLGERDCSAQRRSQKIVEESPAPSVSSALREQMGADAVRLAASVGYVGAGTVEFLLTDDGSYFFLEMNTRLQVEHPVTEAVVGRDLVEDQLRIAEGRPLAIIQTDIRLSGHAIEARIYAEDPEAGFLPATGRIVVLRWPDGVGIRVDAGIRIGDPVSERYDPLLGKIIAHGRTRHEALARLRSALQATRILGVRTNLRFLRWLIDEPFLTHGEVRTDTLARVRLPKPVEPDETVWRAAAGALLGAGPYGEGPWGGGWRPNAPAAVHVRSGDEERRVELAPLARAGGPSEGDPASALQGGMAYVDVEGQSAEFRLAAPPSIEEALQHAAAGEGVAILTAPMPGRVLAVRAREGDAVPAHAALVIIEAMKMEHAVATPIAGTVSRVSVREGQQVQRGDPLAEVTA